jgi:hypothetical protein
MRLSAHSRFHDEGARAFIALALPCAPRAASLATNARSSQTRLCRFPLYGAATRTGEASTSRFAPTTHTRIAINEGATA